MSAVDFESCYRALLGKDARFDGYFFTGVRSTGIYCRPSCPAITPQRKNCTFFPTAAAAQESGYRACKRCRPDASPGSPEWNVRGDLAARAVRLISEGLVDREGVSGLASRLGYSERHLRRVLIEETGASPLALAMAERARNARILIETTALPVSEIAFASGFSSIRQFNDAIRRIFAKTPRELRAGARLTEFSKESESRTQQLQLRLARRDPFDHECLFSFLSVRAVPGVEEFDSGIYRRAVSLPHGPGVVELWPADGFVSCQLELADLRDLPVAVQKCRQLLDLDADPVAVSDALGSDRWLAGSIKRAPGLRVPGAVDAEEIAVRAVLGQQVSVAAARKAAAKLVEAFGKPLSAPIGNITHLFPSAEVLADADLSAMGLTSARAETLRNLCSAIAGGEVTLDRGADRVEVQSQLRAIPGIGPWTSSYIAMRGLGDPDAFPGGDLGLRRAVEKIRGEKVSPVELERRAESWRPWRAYSAVHLWNQM